MPDQDNSKSQALPNDSETFGSVPQDSEPFRIVPHDSEAFRNLPKNSERKEYCTLTVREVARMFEAAGVARTERSIVNWCQPNKMGVARLDNYFDPNERKYFISPQSAEQAIQEEKAKADKSGSAEEFGTMATGSEKKKSVPQPTSQEHQDQIRELEREVRNLTIADRVKEGLLEQLKKERIEFAHERQGYIEALLKSERHVGELETKLLQLSPPATSPDGSAMESVSLRHG